MTRAEVESMFVEVRARLRPLKCCRSNGWKYIAKNSSYVLSKFVTCDKKYSGFSRQCGRRHYKMSYLINLVGWALALKVVFEPKLERFDHDL